MNNSTALTTIKQESSTSQPSEDEEDNESYNRHENVEEFRIQPRKLSNTMLNEFKSSAPTTYQSNHHHSYPSHRENLVTVKL
jgi:hypothetical protein